MIEPEKTTKETTNIETAIELLRRIASIRAAIKAGKLTNPASIFPDVALLASKVVNGVPVVQIPDVAAYLRKLNIDEQITTELVDTILSPRPDLSFDSSRFRTGVRLYLNLHPDAKLTELGQDIVEMLNTRIRERENTNLANPA